MLQIDLEAKAEFREEPDGSYPRLSFFVASLSMFVAVTFHRTIKRYFIGYFCNCRATYVGHAVPVISVKLSLETRPFSVIVDKWIEMVE